MNDDYVLALPDRGVNLTAADDQDAVQQARKLLVFEKAQCPAIPATYWNGVKLFRYPLKYVTDKTNSLIEVPFYPGVKPL